MNNGATLSVCRTYRYLLWREWDAALQGLTAIMLNPSTADETVDDPTIRRLIGFAQAWGLGSLTVVNLFAYRTPVPKLLTKQLDPVGLDNNKHIVRAADRTLSGGVLLCAWGVHGTWQDRDVAVWNIVKWFNPQCLGTTKDGHPRHPLYMKRDTALVPFELRNR